MYIAGIIDEFAQHITQLEMGAKARVIKGFHYSFHL
jgi:hypothetical protein